MFITIPRGRNSFVHLKCIVYLVYALSHTPAQDRGPFCFSYILNEILRHIEIWNEFLNDCLKMRKVIKLNAENISQRSILYKILSKMHLEK